MNKTIRTLGLLATGVVVGAVAVRVGQDYVAGKILPPDFQLFARDETKDEPAPRAGGFATN